MTAAPEPGILLKLGADPNIVDGDGLAPLHWAAFTGNKKCIMLLLEAGADVRAMNRDCRTAEEMASEFRNGQTWKEVVDELGFKSDGTKVRRPLSEVCCRPRPCSTQAGSPNNTDVAVA